MPVELESSLALYLFKVLVIKIVLFIFATVTVMDLDCLVTQYNCPFQCACYQF